MPVPGYEVLAKLGQGGMGVVYKARHLGLNRLVALKMIRSAEHASAEEVLRFQAEAQAVAALAHPNIVQVYEIGTQGGLPWFAMEYVEGGSLAQFVKEGTLPPSTPPGWWSRSLAALPAPTRPGSCIATSSRRMCCWPSLLALAA
jgi:serine/threonine-protein kinase